jgi:hypothetical protein
MRLAAAMMISGVLLCMPFESSSEPAKPAEKKEEKKRYLYEWVDDKGNYHAADRYEAVPPEYRDKIRKATELPKKPESSGSDAPRRGAEPAPPSDDQDEIERAKWRELIGEWKSRLSKAEARHEQLKQRQSDILRKWGSLALAPIADRLEAEKINEQMAEAQREIQDARNMLEKTIPEDARKAGVPPGWIRD